ncbi:hypothetical protein SABR111722_19320 [Saccharibacillus brassicae]
MYVEQGYNVIEVPQAGQNGFVRPISGAVTSNFGMRTHPINGKQKLHAASILAVRAGSRFRLLKRAR